MRHPPLDVILSWPKPNYISPETRGHSLLAVNVTFLVIAFIAVVARLWARLRIVKSPGLDDLLITIAMVCRLALATHRRKILSQISVVPERGARLPLTKDSFTRSLL